MHLVTEKSLKNLVLGRQKGTNHLSGIPKGKAHKEKMSRIMKEWCENNPDKVKERAKKNRGENHYLWKGGETKISLSIRRMGEMRKWKNEVVWRDKVCQKCFTDIDLEAHHKKTVKEIIEENKITNRDNARACKELWCLENGVALCVKCHCEEHGRKYVATGFGRKKQPRKIRRSFEGTGNPNYKEGLTALTCPICKKEFSVKNCFAKKQKFCSRQCIGISKRKSNSIRTLKGKYDNNN